MKKIDIRKSLNYWKKAEKLIPCGTMTMSKAPQYYVKGASPIYLQRSKGPTLFYFQEMLSPMMRMLIAIHRFLKIVLFAKIY